MMACFARLSDALLRNGVQAEFVKVIYYILHFGYLLAQLSACHLAV